MPELCKDGIRKERQRGIKRGPYKRKNKVPPPDVPQRAHCTYATPLFVIERTDSAAQLKQRTTRESGILPRSLRP